MDKVNQYTQTYDTICYDINKNLSKVSSVDVEVQCKIFKETRTKMCQTKSECIQTPSSNLKDIINKLEIKPFTKLKLVKPQVTRPRSYRKDDISRGLILLSMSRKTLDFARANFPLYSIPCRMTIQNHLRNEVDAYCTA